MKKIKVVGNCMGFENCEVVEIKEIGDNVEIFDLINGDEGIILDNVSFEKVVKCGVEIGLWEMGKDNNLVELSVDMWDKLYDNF
jgi:hypothetical protein